MHRFHLTIIAIAASMLSGCVLVEEPVTEGGQAETQQMASVFQPFRIDQCATVAVAADGPGRRYRCRGFADTPLFVSERHRSFDVDAGHDHGSRDAPPERRAVAPRLEWRLKNGNLIALIVRYETEAAADENSGTISVETIGTARTAGCEIVRIDSARPDAAALARARADMLAPGFACTRDMPERFVNANWHRRNIDTLPVAEYRRFGSGRLLWSAACLGRADGTRELRLFRAGGAQSGSEAVLTFETPSTRIRLPAYRVEGETPGYEAAVTGDSDWYEAIGNAGLVTISLENQSILSSEVSETLLWTVDRCF